MEHWFGVQPGGWPWPIFTVNMLGCMAVGVLIGRFSVQRQVGRAQPEWVRLLLITGFLGGFTTFSTYIWEVVSLADEFDRLPLALVYLFASVVIGMVCVMLGLRVGMASVRSRQVSG